MGGSGERRALRGDDILRDAARGGGTLIGVTLVCMVVSTAGYAAAVPLAGRAVDALLAGGDARPAITAALAGALCGCLGWSASDLVLNHVATAMAVRLRDRMVTHTLSLPVGFFTDRSVGEVTDRISTDVDTVAKGVVAQAKPVAMGLLGAAAALVASLTVDARITALFVPACAAIGAAGWRAVRRVAVTSRSMQGEWADAAGTAEEAFSARDDLRQALGRGFVMRRWAEHCHVTMGHSERLARARNTLALSTVGLLRAFQLVTLAAGVTLAGRGAIGVGGVWAAFGLVTLFSQRIEDVLHNVPRLTEAVAATQRIGELLAEAPEPSTTATDPLGATVRWQEPVAVVFDHLSFAYGTGRTVLDDVSVTVRPGRSLAVIGRTGSGKTTLSRFVNRSLEPPAGTVFLDGVDVGAVDLGELRRHVGVVTQRVELLQATLRENVTLFDPAISDERIRAAFDLLGLRAWLAGVPAGLDAPLGPGALTLSAGEQQLVAFARLLVRDPAVVVLDEATARLDPATEAVVQRATERLLAGRTSIIIAHRLATIAGVDDVVVLDGGRVVEHGTRRALLADPASRFARLVEADGGVAVPGGSVPSPAARPRATAVPAEPVGDRPAPREPGVLATAVAVITCTWRLSLRTLLGWTVFVVSPAFMARVWTGLLPTLEARGPVGPALAVFALAAAVGLAGRLVAEVGFSRWWTTVQSILRSNILAAQLHPHDRHAGRRPESPGDAISRMWDTSDVINYADHLVDIVALSICLVVAIALSGRLATVPWLAAPLALPVVAAVALRGRVERVAVEHARLRSEWSGRVADVCAAVTAVKGFACEAAVARHLDGWTQRRQRAAREQRRLELLILGTVFVTSAAGQRLVVALLAFSPGPIGAEAVGRAVSVAESIALMPMGGVMAVVLIQEAPMVRAKLRRMARLLPARDDFDLLRPPADMRVPPRAAEAVPTRRADRRPLRHLRAEHVRVVHADGTVALDGVSVEIAVGELVLITGPVASGKSTLLRVLAGLERAGAGMLRWNGDEIEEPSAFLRPPNCAYVAQTPRLVSGTVAENVALDHPVDVAAALGVAELASDVAAAGGPGTVVGHRGLRLSGGQAQRLATARAVASRSELLVLDDLSSALDVMTERRLWRNLRGAGATVVASAHKRAALELADRVVVLEAGRVLAQGPWRDLEPDHGHLFA